MKKVIFLLFCFVLSCLTLSCQYTITDSTEDTIDQIKIEKIYDILKNESINSIQLDFKYDKVGDYLYATKDEFSIKLFLDSFKLYDKYVEINYKLYNTKKLYTGKTKYYLDEKNEAGILFSLDDYFPGNWEKYLPYFVGYDIKSTFFCIGDYARFGKFAETAIKDGMEIGYHTLHHNFFTNDTTQEELIVEAINPLEEFSKKAINITAFAFPGGKYSTWMISYLLENSNYKFLRLFINSYSNYSITQINEAKCIYSQSIDNQWFSSEDDFYNKINKYLLITKITNTIWPCTTHYILDDGEHLTGTYGDKYTITKSNLLTLFSQVNYFNMKSYRYKDLSE